jgi:hypothetical protein
MQFRDDDISTSGLPRTINDLNDSYYADEKLSQKELFAIQNYNRYRIDYLNTAKNEADFEKRYLSLRAKANLVDFREFL